RAAASALKRPERERQQRRDRPAEMPGALRDAVGLEREDEAAERGRRGWERQLAQPEVGEPARGQVGQQQEQVPRAHVAEERVERPEDEAERPTAEVPA